MSKRIRYLVSEVKLAYPSNYTHIRNDPSDYIVTLVPPTGSKHSSTTLLLSKDGPRPSVGDVWVLTKEDQDVQRTPR